MTVASKIPLHETVSTTPTDYRSDSSFVAEPSYGTQFFDIRGR